MSTKLERSFLYETKIWKEITMKLCDYISEKDHRDLVMEVQLKELREDGLPIVIFGGGSNAKAVESFLSKNFISVAAFCEGSYYFSQGKIIHGKPVYEFGALPPNLKPCNMVLAASGKNIREIIEKPSEDIKNLYVFDVTVPLFSMSVQWVREHIRELDNTYQMLQDEESREVFLSFIEDKAGCVTKPVKPLWRLWTSDQYFNELYDPKAYSTHALIDCGAWIGDTAVQFLEFLREQKVNGTVYAFEPDPDNFRKLESNVQESDTIQCFPYAVGSERKSVFFATGNGSQSHHWEENSGMKVQMVAIDELLGDKNISMIKMDLEGAEVAALRGMRKIISEKMPMLAICVYHKVDDLITIPQCILELQRGGDKQYKFCLRHHSCTSYETVLYAVPE